MMFRSRGGGRGSDRWMSDSCRGPHPRAWRPCEVQQANAGSRIPRLVVGVEVPYEIARGPCAVGVSVGFLYLAPQDGHLLAKREVLQGRGEGPAEVDADLSAPSKPSPIQLRPEVTAWSFPKPRASHF